MLGAPPRIRTARIERGATRARCRRVTAVPWRYRYVFLRQNARAAWLVGLRKWRDLIEHSQRPPTRQPVGTAGCMSNTCWGFIFVMRPMSATDCRYASRWRAVLLTLPSIRRFSLRPALLRVIVP